MSNLCGCRGFAGSSACILKRGHEGDHSYGNYLEAVVREDREEKELLRQQLADSQKQVVMLRDGLKRADDLLTHSYDHVSPLIREALAATEPKP